MGYDFNKLLSQLCQKAGIKLKEDSFYIQSVLIVIAALNLPADL
jgi:hypothetical protein